MLDVSTELSLKVNGVFPAAERVLIQSEGLGVGVEGGSLSSLCDDKLAIAVGRLRGTPVEWEWLSLTQRRLQ